MVSGLGGPVELCVFTHAKPSQPFLSSHCPSHTLPNSLCLTQGLLQPRWRSNPVARSLLASPKHTVLCTHHQTTKKNLLTIGRDEGSLLVFWISLMLFLIWAEWVLSGTIQTEEGSACPMPVFERQVWASSSSFKKEDGRQRDKAEASAHTSLPFLEVSSLFWTASHQLILVHSHDPV